MNKNCQLFYKRLRILFPSIGFAEGKFLRDIKMQLRDFSIENPGADYEDVVEFFGNPEEVYIDYIHSQGKEQVYNRFQRRKSAHQIIGIIVLLVIGLWAVFSIIWWQGYNAFHNLMPTIKEIEIEEGEYNYERN